MGSCNSNGEYKDNGVFPQTCCLTPDRCHPLVCNATDIDTWHDGYLEINGKRYCTVWGDNSRIENGTRVQNTTICIPFGTPGTT